MGNRHACTASGAAGETGQVLNTNSANLFTAWPAGS
jgi:hypothetical protein